MKTLLKLLVSTATVLVSLWLFSWCFWMMSEANSALAIAGVLGVIIVSAANLFALKRLWRKK